METIKQYSGAILTCIGALVLVVLLCGIFWLLTTLAPQGDGGSLPPTMYGYVHPSSFDARVSTAARR
jgi:hypothetical protein